MSCSLNETQSFQTIAKHKNHNALQYHIFTKDQPTTTAPGQKSVN